MASRCEVSKLEMKLIISAFAFAFGTFVNASPDADAVVSQILSNPSSVGIASLSLAATTGLQDMQASVGGYSNFPLAVCGLLLVFI